MQPGQTVVPGQAPSDQPPAAQSDSTPPPTGQDTQAEAQQPQPPAPPETNWEFKGTGEPEPQGGTPPSVPASSIKPVSWTASEYVSHHKGVSWFLALGMVIVLAAVIVYLITKDVVSAVVIGTVGILFGAFGARKPRVLEYVIDSSGIHIADKLYPYSEFRAFSIQIDEGAHSILLMPAQRFGLPITIYYEPKDEQTIVETLGMSLPMEERSMAVIDRFMGRIRF